VKIRKLALILAAIGILTVFTSCRSLTHIRGNGDMITSERTVSAFEKIQISGSAVVNYRTSQEYRVVVTVDSNLEEYTRVYTDGNVLKIGTKNGKSYSFTKYIVDVYCPTLSAISVSGSVRFNGIDKISVSTFTLRISGSGNIDCYIECNKFNAAISGSGEIDVSGSAKEMNVTASGSATINGREFQTNNAIFNISGSGKISIWVLDYLKAKVSGSGKVTYRGNPKIDYSTSGSGRLESES
jgi:hypothetical protein